MDDEHVCDLSERSALFAVIQDPIRHHLANLRKSDELIPGGRIEVDLAWLARRTRGTIQTDLFRARAENQDDANQNGELDSRYTHARFGSRERFQLDAPDESQRS